MRSTRLYRPVGPDELDLIRSSGWRRFPPRLPEQPIFYPVENEEYARQIACDWNVRSYGAGYVVRFDVESAYIERYAVHQVGNATHRERWIPAEDLEEFNDHLCSPIEVVASFVASNE